MITFPHGRLTPCGESAFNALPMEVAILGVLHLLLLDFSVAGGFFYSAVKK